jgi:hypothetical protein
MKKFPQRERERSRRRAGWRFAVIFITPRGIMEGEKLPPKVAERLEAGDHDR